MDFRFTEQEEAFRRELDEFLKKELPPGWTEENLFWPGGYGTIVEVERENAYRFSREFKRKLAEKGWISISWPKEYGGKGHSAIEQAIFDERMSYYRAPALGVASRITAPTILLYGTEAQKKEWVPRIANAEVEFWLAYSEPDSGSDLASIQTAAVESGDELIVNGQKTFSTGGHLHDHAWMIVRTDPDVPKHKGISLIMVDMKSPGITVRPLANIVGTHSFNEVFFDNVAVPKRNIVGEKNRGWYYVAMALDFERLIVGVGNFRRTFEELVAYTKETRHNGEVLAEDPLVQNKLAEIAIEIEVLYTFFWRVASMQDKGLVAIVEASALKLFATELSLHLAHTAMEIVGPYGQLEARSKWAPLRGRMEAGYLDCISAVVGAGTSEVQRNIIALRGLGLPRE